ncbi:hypothetical protein VSH64_40660 [Amycolatopsis rhabdoformis]|uniref:Uncharacterized protein n=1 Tax=Amycolatopsis rhabdoformis TaxID=1448059 RepID=A0ABZ1I3V7_9PSEU|nr:hypothetical protein [Amycolatopsis rhabdoformis]WSE29067.1 hypothetical protein VSH64_40660 [Amycolatopsis rhabdoformis]
MVYVLEAVIAKAEVLHGLPGTPVIVPLEKGLSLVPVTKAYAASVADPETPVLAPYEKLTRGFADVLAACSKAGPLTYVEAEFFGGDGTQTAQVWEAGAVVFGPVHQPEEAVALPPEGSPISQALRHLGVTVGAEVDEFDAVGLWRHRWTHEWIPSTKDK